MLCAFEDFVLDTDCRELRRADTLLAVEPQVFDLIAFVVANRHRVVSRDDLLEAIWHGRIVSDSTLTSRINTARRVLGDTGAAQRLIRTVHGYGFRFVGDLIETQTQLEKQTQVDGRVGREQPAIAVLPFEDLSEGSRLAWLATSVWEDLTGAVAKVPGISVVAAGPSRGDPRDVAARLGVGFLLAGSVRGSREDLRVTARVVDGVTGCCIWSDRYDRSLTNAFMQLDDIVRRILIEIDEAIGSRDHADNDGRSTRNLDAWLLHRQGRHEMFRFERSANFRARQLFQRAHEVDPDWPRPLACLASTYREAAIRRWEVSPERNLALALEIGEKAVAAAPHSAPITAHFSTVLVSAGRVDEGLRLGEHAVEIAPDDFTALCDFAYCLPSGGEEARSLAYFTRAKRVGPALVGAALANEAFVLHLVGRRQQAIDVLEDCAQGSDLLDTRVRLAAAYYEAGREEEARAKIAEVLACEPDATISEYTGNLNFPDRQRMNWYQDLLRGAGLPENVN